MKLPLWLCLFLVSYGFGAEIECDVIIAGGSTAAFAAAISASHEGSHVCLLEPTNWVGGQLTATGVSAIDFAWHTLINETTHFHLDVAAIDRAKENVTPNFWRVLHNLTTTGRCWVSPFCYPPKELLERGLWVLADETKPNLTIYYNTVVKKVDTDGRYIRSVTAIQRTPRRNVSCDGWDVRASQDLPDWYSHTDSSRFTKETLVFKSKSNKYPIVMDATDWGEILALSQASYLQGLDERFDGDISGLGGSDTCGQSVTIGFVQKLWNQTMPSPPDPFPYPEPNKYSLKHYTWDRIWTYRRVLSSHESVEVDDLSLQNFDGNDYSNGYLFLSKNDTRKSLSQWEGGVSREVMDGAERMALGWEQWFRENAPEKYQGRVTLERTTMGTCTGLVKLPYIRDTRRSIGIDGFVMKVDEISGDAEDMVGHVYPDRLAIGSYDVDYHTITRCIYPLYMKKRYGVLPYFIPLRAMTNRDYDNLVLAGKTMAQSFLVNAASRLHPIEWSSGTAAGVLASYMSLSDMTSQQALKDVVRVQERVKLYTPIAWTIDGKLYPSQ